MRIQDLSPHLRELVDGSFRRLIQTVGGLPNFAESVSLSDSVQLATQPANQIQRYWVDAVNGSDSNGTGGADRPFKTVNAALSRLNRVIGAPTIIHLKAGVYTDVMDLSFTFLNNSSYLVIQGDDWTNVTPATGLASGTFDANFGTPAVPFTATVAGAGWTPHDLKGKFFKVGANFIPIADNTATTVDVPFVPTGDTGDINLRGQPFQIVTPAAIFNGSSGFPIITMTGNAATPVFPTFFDPNVPSSAIAEQGVILLNLQFNFGLRQFTGVNLGNGANLSVAYCKFTVPDGNDAGNMFSLQSGSISNLSLVYCYLELGLDNNSTSIANGFASSAAILLFDNVMNNGRESVAIVNLPTLYVAVFGGIFQAASFAAFTFFGVLLQSDSFLIRNTPIGFDLYDNARIYLQPAIPGTAIMQNCNVAGISTTFEAVSTNAWGNVLKMENGILDTCSTGMLIEGAHNSLDISGTTVKNCTVGINLAADPAAAFNICVINADTVMTGNTIDLFHGANVSLSALRAAPNQTLVEQVRYLNKLTQR